MAYPKEIDQFPAKLNKKADGSVYVVEETLPITNGKFEGLLAHDNITNTSIRVYTGPKLTGDEIVNYIISIPSDTTWRRHIKVFADVSKVYVSYETQGDTVEADDVNVLQDAMTATQGEVDRYKAVNDAAVSGIDSRLTIVETNKAEMTYVDTQLLLKADKANTYTKTETNDRIQAVVSAAPEALDTLKEIAASLNNDADFAGTMTTQLAGKVDKVIGKGLSAEDYTTDEKAKLAGIATGAGTAGSAADTVIGSRTITDTEVPNSNSGMLTTLFNWLANMVKSITGKPNWRTAPAITLEATKTHVDNTVSHITADERTAWEAKSSLALGETSGTAYRGDRGKIAYDHSQSAHAPSNANYYAHPNSGVSAGTYRSVTVNAQGHVTGGTNPTTLAGYGITDAAKTAAGVPVGGNAGQILAKISKTDYDTEWIDGSSSHGKHFFTTSGTFTVPDGVTKVWVSMCGGGGGSGYHVYNSGLAGGGGGAACLAQEVTVASGESITVTVGTAGAAGTSSSTAGKAGGTSSFGSYLSCSGGGGANGATPGTAGGINSTAGFAESINMSGGYGGLSLFGLSIPYTGNKTHPIAGAGYGAGGGGAHEYTPTCDGAAGAPGFVLVEW